MKKIVLMVILNLFAYGQIFAQSKPIMGYDKVEWGASVLDVRKAYNLGNSFVLQENYENNVDVAALVQKNVSESIEERIFMFNKWKGGYQLYRVWVTYWDVGIVQNLQTGLANKYGEKTGFKKDSERRYIYKETSTYGKYSPDLLVELIYTWADIAGGGNVVIHDGRGNVLANIGSKDLGIDSPLQVCYTWKKFRDSYQSRNVEF